MSARGVVIICAAAALVAAAFALAVGDARSGTRGPPTGAAVRQALDGVVLPYISAHPGDLIGVCVGGVDGSVRIARCYGTVRFGQKRRPDLDTLFGLGSVSKTFAATLLALRAHQHGVDLTDPVADYIPAQDDRVQVPAGMQLAQLAQHYSGLPRKPPIEPLTSVDQQLSEVGTCEHTQNCTVGTPGQRYLYSNFAFGVLGNILALHDGISAMTMAYSPWEVDNVQAIATPLGLDSTRSWNYWRATRPQYFDAHRATGHTGTVNPHEPNPPIFASAPVSDAAGGLFSSPRDMLRWVAFSMGLKPRGTADLRGAQRLLLDSSLARPRDHDPKKLIGLAWSLTTSGGWTCAAKDGAAPGFRAAAVFVKDQKRGVFVLLNNSPSHTTSTTLAKQLLNALPPLNPGPVPTCPVPDAED